MKHKKTNTEFKNYWLTPHEILNLDNYIYQYNENIVIINNKGLFYSDFNQGAPNPFPAVFHNGRYYNIDLISQFIQTRGKTTLRYYFKSKPTHIEMLPEIMFDSEKLAYYVEYKNCLILKILHDKWIQFKLPYDNCEIYFTKLITKDKFYTYFNIFKKYNLKEATKSLYKYKNNESYLFLLND